MSFTELDSKIQPSQLFQDLLAKYNENYGAGTMTTTIYDTAWVSMISKKVNGDPLWLSMLSFVYLLDNQEPSGGWVAYACPIDGILNTAAALLSLHKHHESPYQLDVGFLAQLPGRIHRAKEFLESALQNWDPTTTRHVGFEILVPCLLDLLEQHGDRIEFAGREKLLEIRDQKLENFDPQIFYNHQTSALHSLEGYIGRIDFDRIKHHKVFGSMMGSPSATSAYLIHSLVWDVECEEYIHHVIEAGTGNGNGSVPSAFPSHLFEISWAMTTLFESGFTIADLGPSLETMQQILNHAFEKGSGVIGFAPSLAPDADDTAKGMVALNFLGRDIPKSNLIQSYWQGERFSTYRNERDSSFSANCNGLTCLTFPVTSCGIYMSEIEKLTLFLCNAWLSNSNVTEDKWNLSAQYSTMLLVQALSRVLDLWAEGTLSLLPSELLREKVLLVLFEAMVRTLHTQTTDGSWNGSAEATAYAILTINSIITLPMFYTIASRISLALKDACNFIRREIDSDAHPGFHWIEKVTYSSRTVSKAYLLAALNQSPKSFTNTGRLSELFKDVLVDVSKPILFFEQLPMFAATPRWCLSASLIQGAFYTKKLEETLSSIFGQQVNRKAKHLKFIPFTWIGANDTLGTVLSFDILLEMMIVSAVAFDVDYIMESDVASLSKHERLLIRAAIMDLFDSKREEIDFGTTSFAHQGIKRKSPCDSIGDGIAVNPYSSTSKLQHQRISQIATKMKRFVDYFLLQPMVQKASYYDQAQLRYAIRDYLVAHLTQIEDNYELCNQPQEHANGNKWFFKSRGSFHSWIRSTSGNHTAAPFAFCYFLCLLSPKPGRDCFDSVGEKYVAEDVSRHLASMCRLYNDWGSLSRDREEDNLNSVQFPEFAEGMQKSTVADVLLKERLFSVAEYERSRYENSMTALQKITNEKVYSALKVFCTAADMYGQMYILRDLTPNIKRQAGRAL